MYGQIFKEVVGKPVTDFRNLIDMEKAAESSLGESLKIQSIASPLVTCHGNIFPYMAGLLNQIEQRIDRFLNLAK